MKPDVSAFHVLASKALSRVLRHRAVAIGIPMRADGYCDLGHVMCAINTRRSLPFQLTESVVKTVVTESPKQRFQIIRDRQGVVWIRACQGHSIPGILRDATAERVPPEAMPAWLVHFSPKECVKSIFELGLLPGGLHGDRCDVHTLQYDVQHGIVPTELHGNEYDLRAWQHILRHAIVPSEYPLPRGDVLWFICVTDAINAGCAFYKSHNQVYLSSKVPSHALAQTVELHTGYVLAEWF